MTQVHCSPLLSSMLILGFLYLYRVTTSTVTTIAPTPVRNWLQALLFYWTTLCRIIWLYVPYSSRRLADEDYEISPRLTRSATFTGRGWWSRRQSLTSPDEMRSASARNRKESAWLEASSAATILCSDRICKGNVESFVLCFAVRGIHANMFPRQITYPTGRAIGRLFARRYLSGKKKQNWRIALYT